MLYEADDGNQIVISKTFGPDNSYLTTGWEFGDYNSVSGFSPYRDIR